MVVQLLGLRLTASHRICLVGTHVQRVHTVGQPLSLTPFEGSVSVCFMFSVFVMHCKLFCFAV